MYVLLIFVFTRSQGQPPTQCVANDDGGPLVLLPEYQDVRHCAGIELKSLRLLGKRSTHWTTPAAAY